MGPILDGVRSSRFYGSHIFQDLVEAQILYTAIFETRKTLHYHPEKLVSAPQCLTSFFPDQEKLEDVLHICDVSEKDSMLYYDLNHERLLVTI